MCSNGYKHLLIQEILDSPVFPADIVATMTIATQRSFVPTAKHIMKVYRSCIANVLLKQELLHHPQSSELRTCGLKDMLYDMIISSYKIAIELPPPIWDPDYAHRPAQYCRIHSIYSRSRPPLS